MAEIIAKPIIFLAFANDRQDYLHNLKLEQRGIRSALRSAEEAGLCEVIYETNTSIDDILDVFQKYPDRIALFHYGGHADDYLLLLESAAGERSEAHSEGLVSFLARQKGLQMVFINGCSSRKQAEELREAGLPAVVGTARPIDDAIATELSTRFYKGLAAGRTIERAWGEAVDQVKMQKGEENYRGISFAGKPDGKVSFPWNLYIREGAEVVRDWNLPDASRNPLFGLPELPAKYTLPEEPFRFLRFYEREHAGIFFGRSYYIRDLHNRISDPHGPPVILLYGQSGAGKSSLFDAGLGPRLEEEYTVRYIRRIQGKGLAGSLEVALQEAMAEGGKREAESGKRKAESGKGEAGSAEHESATRQQVPFSGSEATAGEGPGMGRPNQDFIAQLQALAEKAEGIAKTEIETLIQRLTTRNQKPEARSQPPAASGQPPAASSQLWHSIEAHAGKPLVIILDQAEEVFTRPNDDLPLELQQFILMINGIFGSPEHLPRGRLILGYRKEYHPEIVEHFKAVHLPRSTVFLKQLNERDILDIFQGLTETPAVKSRYRLSVDEELPAMIANDLSRDKDSPVAPVLQILLTRLWQGAVTENPAAPHFSKDAYQQLRENGLGMGEFFRTQMKKLQQQMSEAVDSGLVLGILKRHTTPTGTAGACSEKDLSEAYRHRGDVLQSIKKELKTLFLLTDTGRSENFSKLTHDTLAPVVLAEYNNSDRPGQRAARILANKMTDFRAGEENIWLDENDLAIVVEGRAGMPALSEAEELLMALSRRKKAENERARKLRMIAGAVAVALITLAGILAYFNWQKAERQANIANSNLYSIRANDLEAVNPTEALKIAAEAYRIAPTQAADKSLLNIFYGSVRNKSPFYHRNLKHPAPVYLLDAAGDGRHFLTVAEDSLIRIWNMDGILQVTAGHRLGRFSSACFSPDGKKVLSAADDARAILWNIAGDSLAAAAHIGDVNTAIFSHDGSKIASASSDGLVKVWQPDGELLVEFLHPQAVTAAVFSPVENTLLLTLADDDSLRLWKQDGQNDRIQLTIGDALPIQKAGFSRNGAQILAAAGDQKILVWDIAGDSLVAAFSAGDTGRPLAVSDDGRFLMENYREAVKLRELPPNQRRDRFDRQSLAAGAIENFDNGYGLATAVIHERPEISIFRHDYDSKINAAIFSNDGHRVITAAEGGSVRIWPTVQKQVLELMHEDAALTAGFSADGREVLSAGRDAARLWSASGVLLKTFRHEDDVCSAVYSPDGRGILTASYDGTARLWTREGDFLQKFVHADTLFGAVFSPDGKKILTASFDYTAKLWSIGGDSLAVFEHYDRVNQATFSPDGSKVLTASDDNTARLWSTSGDSLTTMEHFGYVHQAIFSPDGSKILTAANDYSARLWNVAGDSLANFQHDAEVYRAIFSPDGRQILTAGFDNSARLWDLQGRQLAKLIHGGPVLSLAFSPDGGRILSAASPGTVRFWSTDGDSLLILPHTENVRSVAFSPDGNRFLSACGDKKVRIWKNSQAIIAELSNH